MEGHQGSAKAGHAIAAAQNLLVSFAEKAVDEGRIDTILVPRVSEVPSRSLRSITVDAGKNNVAEKVVLTPTSELMQIVVLSRSMDEIGERVAAMIAGTKDGEPVKFGDFIDCGASPICSPMRSSRRSPRR